MSYSKAPDASLFCAGVLFVTLIPTVVVAAPSLAEIVDQRLKASDVPACLAVSVIRSTPETVIRCHPSANQKVTRDSLFEIGSISKALTGLLLADFVSRGELRLDDPASAHSRKGATLPTRAGKEITLRNLVSHTSGLPPFPPVAYGAQPHDPYAKFNVDALYEVLAKTGLEAEPGERYRYSNFGFMWLSEILVRVGGKSFEQLLKERVFAPLGMISAGVATTTSAETKRLVGHVNDYEPVAPRTVDDRLAGSGGIVASLRDMERLAEALAGARKTPLEPVIERAFQPLAEISSSGSVGYGWNVWKMGGSALREHSGNAPGFFANILADPDSREAVVVLSDSETAIADLSLHLLKPAYPLRSLPSERPLEGKTGEQYAGRFRLSSGQVIEVNENRARLRACCTSDGRAIEMFSVAPDRFLVRGLLAPINFVRGADGKVSEISIFFAGGFESAKRVQ
jgi:serine-type D-Ala-D-Ala carboxypeptidase/endopeptidase